MLECFLTNNLIDKKEFSNFFFFWGPPCFRIVSTKNKSAKCHYYAGYIINNYISLPIKYHSNQGYRSRVIVSQTAKLSAKSAS